MADLIVSTEVALKGVSDLLAAAGPRGNVAVARALNRTGGPTATATKRIIRKTLGIRQHPYSKKRLGNYLNKATSIRKANAGRLEFSMAGFGKGLPLIFYQPREGAAGATVNWLGQRKLIKRSFYLSGKFPGRRRSAISDRVSQRVGKGRWQISRPLGPGVAEAMQASPVRRSWEATAAARLPHHLREALLAALRGY